MKGSTAVISAGATEDNLTGNSIARRTIAAIPHFLLPDNIERIFKRVGVLL